MTTPIIGGEKERTARVSERSFRERRDAKVTLREKKWISSAGTSLERRLVLTPFLLASVKYRSGFFVWRAISGKRKREQALSHNPRGESI